MLHDKYVAAASSTAQLVASFCDNILKIEAIKEALHKMILEDDEAEAEFGFILVKVGDNRPNLVLFLLRILMLRKTFVRIVLLGLCFGQPLF